MSEQSNVWIFLLVVVVLLGAFFASDANLGKPAPDFSLLESDGGPVDLASYRGRPVSSPQGCRPFCLG